MATVGGYHGSDGNGYHDSGRQREHTLSENVKPDFPVPQATKAQEALVGFWWTSLLLKKKAQKFFKDLGSSEAHFNLLATLRAADGPLTQSELSERLLVDKSNTSGLLDRMEAAGVLRRNKVDGDRRSYHITLTDRGRKLVETLDAQYTGMVDKAMADFAEVEKAELVRLTRKLRVALLALDV